MRRHRWIRLAPIAFSAMIASCAASHPLPASPRLILPETATRPCLLDRLPESPTLGDLEVAYVSRGAALVACDAARELAVATLLAEREMQDNWQRATAPRRRWLW